MTKELAEKLCENIFFEYYNREYGLEKEQMKITIKSAMKEDLVYAAINGDFLEGRTVVAVVKDDSIKMIIRNVEAVIDVPQCNFDVYGG